MLGRAVAGLLIGITLFSGCIGSDAPLSQPSDSLSVDPNVAVDGRDLTTDLLATDVLSGPGWEVGQWFGAHVFIGMDDTEGFHTNAIVVEDLGSSWMVATDTQDVAKYEAMFDLMFFGAFDKTTLDTTFGGESWPWYEWPLSDGKTWNRDLTVLDFEGGPPAEFSLTYTATYNAAISTTDGDRPGFDIMAHTSDGKMFLNYDYVPAIGWFSHFFAYDPASEEPEDWQFHVMSMGAGKNFTGTYYIDTARAFDPVSKDFHAFILDPESDPGSWGGQVEAWSAGAVTWAETPPIHTFSVAETATHLHVFIWSYAFLGVHETLLIDPGGEQHEYQAQGTSASEDGAVVKFDEISLDAVAGDWRLVVAGAGAAVGGGAMIFEITEEAAEL